MAQDLKLINQFAQVYRSLMDTITEEICLHRAQVSVLSALYMQEGMTQSELGEQLCVQGATITNMLQRMEDNGLISRQRDPEDNRLVRVYLTDTGREKEKAIMEQLARLDTALFEGFSEDERTAFRQFLTRLLGTMNDMSA